MNRLGGWMINMGGGTCAPNPSIFPSNLFRLAIAAALAGSLIQVACQARILLQISGLYLRLDTLDTHWTPARGQAHRIHQSAHATFLFHHCSTGRFLVPFICANPFHIRLPCARALYPQHDGATRHSEGSSGTFQLPDVPHHTKQLGPKQILGSVKNRTPDQSKIRPN